MHENTKLHEHTFARRLICTRAQNCTEIKIARRQNCTKVNFCTKKILHEGIYLHEQTILHADTFARVTILHGGLILHGFCILPRDGLELRVDIFAPGEKIARENSFARKQFCTKFFYLIFKNNKMSELKKLITK